MYHPYFRGKQYELIAIRENAQLLSQRGFIPIIEPVRESLSGLRRAVDAVTSSGGHAILIVNPHHGDHSQDAQVVEDFIADDLAMQPTISVGILATAGLTTDNLIASCAAYPGRSTTIVHAGFTDARTLGQRLSGGGAPVVERHVFVEEHCGKLYRKHFSAPFRVLVRDGFKRRSNREYPPIEFFSDLHATYPEEGATGFGDFLVVGDEYSESGGPAYAVAIHLTFIDPDNDEGMYVFHFVSDKTDSPADPAGNFAEALRKLVAEVDRNGTHVRRTKAVDEFVDLHARGHFPGLGYVKKLSMQHHIETIAEYFKGP